MSTVLVKLKQLGQCLDSDLAAHCEMSRRAVMNDLYPHVESGKVMACVVMDASGKRTGIEYRLSGTIPRSRPGPKVGAKA